MQNRSLLWVVALLFLSAAVSAQTQIDAAQTTAFRLKDPSIQLVDVRTPAEWQQTGVIEGARKMNYNSPDFQQQVAQLDKTKPVIVYCAAGGRSPKAAKLLLKMGFQNVYDYAGGMNDWKARGNKTVQ
ncbi:MAG: rhodanese-like domain-containing protein [Saprospiraceae bacterium]|nr:rhodanese-like domain-containing protein [Saprospiraceae bacterium]